MNKKLKSIEVGLIGCGDAVTLNASDTATEPIATYALDEFKAEKQMSFKDNGKEYFVPFHAVDHIYVSESDTEVADRPNPYGCEPRGGTDGEPWFVGTIDPSGACSDSRQVALTLTEAADEEALVNAKEGDFAVRINDTELSTFVDLDSSKIYMAGGTATSPAYPAVVYEADDADEDSVADSVENAIAAVPCDWTGEVKVYVTKK